MATSKDILKERLGRYRQITISVIGRKTGRRISIPVWFVLEGDELHLLPVAGSESQWYKNVRKKLLISYVLSAGNPPPDPGLESKVALPDYPGSIPMLVGKLKPSDVSDH